MLPFIHKALSMGLTVVLVGALAQCTAGGGTTPPSPTPTPGPTGARYAVVDEDVTVNAGTEWALGGTLTIPDGAPAPYPAVVIVQGSGPQDRDETIYANKPFRDLAEGLAAAGIAVLRYDKRTYTYQTTIATQVADLTVEEETIQDVLAAADLLRADRRIDPGRVFLLGHSEGGMLAPRIDAEGGDFAGLILLAGSPRTLSDIILDQATAQVDALSGDLKTTGQQQLADLTATFASLATLSDDEAKKVTIMGASGYYFKEMNAHPASGYLETLTKPLFIGQGDKDFQVSVERDYGAYQTLLAGRANVTFTLYPGLNHLFMPSTTGTADEYKTASHVDPAVIGDLADWILSH